MNRKMWKALFSDPMGPDGARFKWYAQRHDRRHKAYNPTCAEDMDAGNY